MPKADNVNEENLKELESAIKTLELKKVDLQNKVSALETNKEALETRVLHLETKRKQTQDQIDEEKKELASRKTMFEKDKEAENKKIDENRAAIAKDRQELNGLREQVELDKRNLRMAQENTEKAKTDAVSALRAYNSMKSDLEAKETHFEQKLTQLQGTIRDSIDNLRK